MKSNKIIIHNGGTPLCEDGKCYEPNKDGETGWCTEWKKDVNGKDQACRYFKSRYDDDEDDDDDDDDDDNEED